jgi:hypothetical protein
MQTTALVLLSPQKLASTYLGACARIQKQTTFYTRPNSQFRILLWHFTAPARKCEKTSPRTLTTKNCLLHNISAPSHSSFFTTKFLTENNMPVVRHPPYFSVPPIEDKIERPPCWHNWGDEGRIAGGRRWWPIGPKLVFNQMEAPVPEIMDGSLYGRWNSVGEGKMEPVSSYISHRQNMQTLRSARELGYRQDSDSTW